MKASSELDALIAEKIMGCKVIYHPQKEFRHLCGCGNNDHGTERDGIMDGAQYLKEYSYDLNDAWEVVEKIGTIWNGFEFLLRWSGYGDCWQAGWVEDDNSGYEGRAFENGATPAEAICLAALQAIKS